MGDQHYCHVCKRHVPRAPGTEVIGGYFTVGVSHTIIPYWFGLPCQNSAFRTYQRTEQVQHLEQLLKDVVDW